MDIEVAAAWVPRLGRPVNVVVPIVDALPDAPPDM